MSEHTPGKLVVRGGYSIYTADDKTPVADTCLTNSVPDNDEANARRLVAAWNWCDGLSTQNLEDNVPAKELAHRYNAVIAERDSLRAVNAELLGALKACHSTLKILGDAHDNDVSPFVWRDSGAEASELTALNLLLKNNRADDARAAIASARKQGEQG